MSCEQGKRWLGYLFIHVKVCLKKGVVPPTDWPTLLLSQTVTYINTPTISSQLLFLPKRPTKIEQCSETSAQNAAKVSNQENLDVLEIIKNSTRLGHVLWNDISNEKWT
jgi:hypothetical protein